MPDHAQTGDRRRRRDFDESREMILEAADEAFVADGLGVSMKEVAARAEVSTATLYRHFANKPALVRAVYEGRIASYSEAIEAAGQIEDPAESFRRTIHGIVELQARDRFFREYVREHDDPFNDELLVRFGAPLIAAIEAAKKARVLRAGVEVTDVFALLTTIEGISRPLSSVAADGLTRLVDLVLDGICEDREGSKLAPLSYEQLLAVIKH